MPSSLNKLASYLSNDEKKVTRKYCRYDLEFNLLTRNGVFPYEYIDNWSKLDEDRLTPKEVLYSELNIKNITEENYTHPSKVWEVFNVQSLGEYSDLHLKTDVLLLSNIFENFRRHCLLTYNLDPLHYYTAPGLAFYAILKHTGIELQLLTDPEMLLFIESAIRGGLSQCSNRYAKANNRYMESNFNAYEYPESL